MMNKSDKEAKKAFSVYLSRNGYVDVKVVKEPSDIIAYKDGVKYFFEIKKTSAGKEYFGAATLTEWRAAYANPGNYFFVVCQEVGDYFNFITYTPEEFEKFSTVPPFKVFFNISLDGDNKVLSKRRNKTAIRFKKESFDKLDALFTILRNE